MCGASNTFSDVLLNLRSDDDGATWVVTRTPIAFSPHHAGDQLHIALTSRSTARVTITSGIALSLDASYLTIDGGRTWTTQMVHAAP
jgi:photosystem II stability/assembly factor-like uncharacterized protein